MALTPYCTPDEVRAALGVNDIELPDRMLNLPVYELGLTRELRQVGLSLPAAFSTASQAEPRTDEQQALVEATREWAVYCVARQVGTSLAMLAPKDVTDDKASIGRFAGDSIKDTLARVEGLYQTTRGALVVALAAATGTPSTSSGFLLPIAAIAVGRIADPVTGA